MAEKLVSLKPSDFEARGGGGLFSDANVTITKARMVMWDYNGKIPEKIPAIYCEFLTEDGETENNYWKIANSTEFTPSADGKGLAQISKVETLNPNTNGSIFLTSLIDAGFPEDKLSDISSIEGLSCYVVRIPATNRSGIVKVPRADGKVFVDTILVVETINAYPWDAKSKGKAKGKGKGSKDNGAGTVDGKLDKAATDLMLGILAENPEIDKGSLPGLIFGALESEKDVNVKSAMVRLIYGDDTFLSGDDRPWKFEDGIVSL